MLGSRRRRSRAGGASGPTQQRRGLQALELLTYVTHALPEAPSHHPLWQLLPLLRDAVGRRDVRVHLLVRVIVVSAYMNICLHEYLPT